MIKAIIIDDEENNCVVLQTLLAKNCPNIRVVDVAGNVDDAFIKIGRYKPQLLFLDIKMPQKNGFDLLKMFSEIDFEVIFITAYDNYAIRAFEFNAIDYLLKPIDPLKLIKAIEKASSRILAKTHNDFVLHFVKTISDKKELVNKFSFHNNGRVVFVNLTDISFIETKVDNTTIHLYDNSQYYSSKDLVKFETVLQGMTNFIRLNKNVIINTDHLKSYSKGEICTIDMKSGQSFEVSRRRKSEILKVLKALLL